MKRILILIPVLALAGCVQTKFTTPNGFMFQTTRFMWNGQIQSAEISSNGTARIEGYTSDAAAVARAAAEGVAAGMMKAVK